MNSNHLIPPDLIWPTSPIVLAPIRRAKGETLLAACLDFLIEGKNLSPKTSEAAKTYQRMVVAEFCRITFYENYPVHKEEGTTEIALEYKKLIELEAQVLKRLYLLITKLYDLNELPYTKIDHPLIVFFQVVIESQIALFNHFKKGITKGFATATDWKKENAHFNRYPEKMAGLTGQVMKTARALADKDDEFRKKSFNPLMDARKALMGHFKKSRTITHLGEHGIPVRQGRGLQQQRREI
jgi:hypothetical protein